ncbi:dockerin type 1 [Paenibacillus sp. P3E]|uniref:carbohydrate-binding domain-containing protein n=1 Tax=Paenibacillus sp. P3E TaxID=1349435 RepID=UPI00093C365D|nr:carbohydrate-binding domain-containing protein [Paenibacillus sp. P3E]OKP93192.1 dockerin type 1 [Paenibacillus sp. P3E]
MKNFITGSKIGMVLLSAALMTACSTTSGANTNTTNRAATGTAVTTRAQSGTTAAVALANVKTTDLVAYDEDDTTTDWTADASTDITLAGTTAKIEGAGATAKDGSVTITEAGTYILTGSLSDGQIIVDEQAKGTVRLVLNGVNLKVSDSAPVYIKEAGKVVITLQEGTENSVSDGTTYVFADSTTDGPGAAIFSKADLTINGTGKLTVTGSFKDGISSKDDLKIVGGTLNITAADDGIVGKDLVAVKNGNITIKAEGDGIKSTNDEDTTKGFVAIAAGTFDITAGNDGIQSETAEVIDGGTFNIVTNGGYENAAAKTGEQGPGGMGMGGGKGGFGDQGAVDGTSAATSDDTPAKTTAAAATDTATVTTASVTTAVATATTAETESTSAKGLKSGGDLTVNGGSFTLNSADDALHSNGNVSVTDGEFKITAGDDGIHADSLTSLSGGTIDITKSYEGIEGSNITIAGGQIHVVASDDGVNVSGGNDANTAQGTAQQDQFTSSGSNMLTISGGTITVDSTGDGLDSNGSFTMTGGTAIVNGPTNDGNGPLDYDGTFDMTGGFLVAAGSAGMAQAPSEDSSQYSVSMSFTADQQAGTPVHLEDSDGNTILTVAPSKNFRSVVVSSPDLKKGGSYTLSTGGTSTGTAVDGLYTDGEYSGGTQVVAFDISSSVTWLNESGVTTANTGRGPGGGGGGTRPDRGAGGTPPQGGTGGTPPDAASETTN